MTRFWTLLLPLLLFLFLCVPRGASAHEMRPGYVELIEEVDGSVAVTFRQPIVNGRYLNLQLQLDCEPLSQASSQLNDQTLTQTSRVRCAQGLAGNTVAVLGLNRTLTDVLVLVTFADGRSIHHVLKPGAPVLDLKESKPHFLPVYLGLGIQHLLTGQDHVLFLIALLVLVRGGWPLVRAITAFTIAHSITLALSTLDVIQLSQAPVEAVIALSIVYVAWEITENNDATLVARYPWSIAFIFGLLHGLGFSGVLREIGLPHGEAAWALLLFNLGIELGQLLILGAALGLVAALRRLPHLARLPTETVRLVPAYVIGPIAVYWVIQRVTGL